MDAWVQARKATVHEMHILQRTTTDVFFSRISRTTIHTQSSSTLNVLPRHRLLPASDGQPFYSIKNHVELLPK